eukprot:scaffold2176_cov350-Prasinococcus_capsulatus_cf.AAC.11
MFSKSTDALERTWPAAAWHIPSGTRSTAGAAPCMASPASEHMHSWDINTAPHARRSRDIRDAVPVHRTSQSPRKKRASCVSEPGVNITRW